MSGVRRSPQQLRSFLEANVEIITWTGCWIWMGHLRTRHTGQERGSIRRGKQRFLAHRLSYEVYKEPVPDGLLVLHTCDMSICINPKHLYIGTALNNANDRDSRNRNGLRGRVGDACASTKIKELQRLEIIELRKKRLFSIADLASIYKVSAGTIGKICLPVCGHIKVKNARTS